MDKISKVVGLLQQRKTDQPADGLDGNENAKVDAADYTVWRDNLGASGSASLSGAVPEPSAISLGMLALGAAGVTALRRR